VYLVRRLQRQVGVISNSTVSGNSVFSFGDGGGVFNDDGTVNVKSSIIALNDAPPEQSGEQFPDIVGVFGSQGSISSVPPTAARDSRTQQTSPAP